MLRILDQVLLKVQSPETIWKCDDRTVLIVFAVFCFLCLFKQCVLIPKSLTVLAFESAFQLCQLALVD